MNDVKSENKLNVYSLNLNINNAKSPYAIWHKNWTIKIYIRLMYFLIANYLCTYLKKKSSLNMYINKMIAVEKLYFFPVLRTKIAYLGYFFSLNSQSDKIAS